MNIYYNHNSQLLLQGAWKKMKKKYETIADLAWSAAIRLVRSNATAEEQRIKSMSDEEAARLSSAFLKIPTGQTDSNVIKYFRDLGWSAQVAKNTVRQLSPKPGLPPKPRKRRLSASARKAISVRMRKLWAERRKAKKAGRKK